MGRNWAATRKRTEKAPPKDEDIPEPDPTWTAGRVLYWFAVFVVISLLYLWFYVLLHEDTGKCNSYDLQCD